jgi:hypothetical protein
MGSQIEIVVMDADVDADDRIGLGRLQEGFLIRMPSV